MHISDLYLIFKENPIITTDSRNCPKNSLFFALKGENFNGNHFAEKALADGCSFAVVDEWDKPEHNRVIVVDDVLKTLQELATYHRRKLKTPILGITGTNGKTTTKELVATTLSQEFRVAFTQGNFNNHIGVPLTLLSITKEHEMAVVEMGANHPGEIAMLCKIVEPNFGLITNVGKAHIEGFGSFENIIKTKGELYDYIRKHGGKVFVNKDNEHLYKLSEGMDRILYGKNDPSLFASATITDATPFLQFDWSFFDKAYRVSTNLVGEYNLDNALAAVAVGKFFGINADKISYALQNYEPKNNRSQFERTEHNELIIDAYNANPTSMKASLDFFAKIPTPLPKIAILGEMKELGTISTDEHTRMVAYLQKLGFEQIYLVGAVFGDINVEPTDTLKVFEDVQQLIKQLELHPLRNRYILLKGSHSIHLEKTIPYL